jgi:hypothetical protein
MLPVATKYSLGEEEPEATWAPSRYMTRAVADWIVRARAMRLVMEMLRERNTLKAGGSGEKAIERKRTDARGRLTSGGSSQKLLKYAVRSTATATATATKTVARQRRRVRQQRRQQACGHHAHA